MGATEVEMQMKGRLRAGDASAVFDQGLLPFLSVVVGRVIAASVSIDAVR